MKDTGIGIASGYTNDKEMEAAYHAYLEALTEQERKILDGFSRELALWLNHARD